MPKKKPQAQQPTNLLHSENQFILSTEEISELKLLLKQVEQSVSQINNPLIILSYIGVLKITQPWFMNSILFKSRDMVVELSKDKHPLAASAAIVSACLIVLTTYYGVYSLWSKIKKTINGIFPLGFPAFISKLNLLFTTQKTKSKIPKKDQEKIILEALDQAKKLLQGHELDIDPQNLISLIQQVVDNDLRPTAHKITLLQILTIFLSPSLPAYSKFQLIVHATAIQQLYESRKLLYKFLNNKQYDTKKEKNFNALCRISLNPNWAPLEYKLQSPGNGATMDFEKLRFTLRFDHKNVSVEIPVIEGVNGIAFSISAKTYLNELKAVLKKGGFSSIERDDRSIVVGNESLSEKKIRKLKRELVERLKRQFEFQQHNQIKSKQLDNLIKAAGGNACWFPLRKTDSSGFSTTHFAIVDNAVHPKIKDDFLNELCLLYGSQCIKKDSGSIYVEGHLSCSEKELNKSIKKLKELYEKLLPKPDNHADNSTTFTDVGIAQSLESSKINRKKRNHQNSDTDSKGDSKSDSKNNSSVTDNTTQQIMTRLNLKDSQRLFPMSVPWSNGNNIYFALVDTDELKKEFGESTSNQFINYFENGKVQPEGGWGVGLFSASKNGSLFQAKNKRNIRTLGTITQTLIVNDQKRNIVKFGTYITREH